VREKPAKDVAPELAAFRHGLADTVNSVATPDSRTFSEEGCPMDSGAPLAIGTLAKRTGTNVETIRYYERVGLWAVPARSAGGYRLYGKGHLKRLNFIRRSRVLGFSIDQVRTLLRLADERKGPCAEVRGVAEAHLADVRSKIADLRTMERVLKETVTRCADGAGAQCPLIDSLYRDGPLAAP
jgi:MerR family mercuric resistance operon transcriptional regulator